VALAGYSLVYTVLATTGLILLRRSLANATLESVIADPAFFAGALCYAASFATFLLALRRFEVLTVYPTFTGLAYASVTVAAAIFLGESLTPSRVTGILLVGGGVTLLVR
jgi:multidrug transporter EmrE-like cation transporter